MRICRTLAGALLVHCYASESSGTGSARCWVSDLETGGVPQHALNAFVAALPLEQQHFTARLCMEYRASQPIQVASLQARHARIASKKLHIQSSFMPP